MKAFVSWIVGLLLIDILEITLKKLFLNTIIIVF